MEPATSIIRKMGGVGAVSGVLNKNRSVVYRFKVPVEKHGRGGLIPMADAVRLLRYARANDIDLRPEDFFPDEILDAAA